MDTQGSELYFIDPDTQQVMDAGCINQITGISVPKDQRENTCLRDKDRRYKPGMGNPGSATLEVQFDPQDPAHIKLYKLYKANKVVSFTLGFSDATGTEPGVNQSGDDFDLPENRTWILFDAYISDWPWDFSQNSEVTNSLPVQISGGVDLVVATETDDGSDSTDDTDSSNSSTTESAPAAS